MERTYFIQKQTNNAHKNKVDAMLHEAFQKYTHQLITDDKLELFDNEHEFIVNKYQMAGGRAAIPHFYRRKAAKPDETIHITISETLTFILLPVLGEIQA